MNQLVFINQQTLLVTFFASIFIWIMFLGLVVLWILDGRVKRELVLHVVIVSIVSWIVAQMIKDLFPTVVRPFEINGGPPLTATIPFGSSFPSAHAAGAFGLAFAVWLYNKKMGIFYLLGALVVSLGRIVSNVHFPVDVTGGAVIGIFVALLFEKIHITGVKLKK